MARKNNKKNRRRVAFYSINPFDYEARERMITGQSPPQEIPKEGTVIKFGPGNEWTEAWIPKITVVQITSRKA